MVAPVAQDVSFGDIGQGVRVTVNASDVVTDFASDSDTDLTAASISFDEARIDGVLQPSLGGAGFSFVAGGDDAGSFTIDTEAIAELTVGESVVITVSFTVDDGDSTDAGELTYVVVGGGPNYTATVDLLGATVLGQTIDAEATAGTDETVVDIAVSGPISLEELMADLELTEDADTIDQWFETDNLTIAGAAAGNESTAKADAADTSEATAIAFDLSKANSSASNGSVARAAATDEDSLASAFASDRSTASSVATGSSVSASSSVEDSTAIASATDESATEATATNEANATANATTDSISTAVADDQSDAIAESILDSASTAFAGNMSGAISVAEDNSISNTIALDGSDAEATSTDNSDALSIAKDGADATAISDRDSSSSAGATVGASAEANASVSSTAVAAASDDTSADGLLDAESTAASSSVALALGLRDASAYSDAIDGSAARALASAGEAASAVSTGMQAVSEEKTGGGGPLTADNEALTAFIISEVTVGKAVLADYAMNAVTQYIPSFAPMPVPSLEGLIERFFAPVATNDTAIVDEDASIAVDSVSGVLGNDTDPGEDTLEVVAVKGSTSLVGVSIVGTYGTLILRSDGSYSYAADQPTADALAVGASAVDTFVYQVADNGFLSPANEDFLSADTATLEITINGVDNDGGASGGGGGSPTVPITITPNAVALVTLPADGGGTKTVSGNSATVDEVQIAGSVILGPNLENAVLTGSDDFSVTGNHLDNVIYGNAGNNLIFASAGRDFIDGGTGFDTVKFDGNADDFVVSIDLPNVTVSGADGSITTLSGIQQISFDDGDVPLFAVDHAKVHALYLSFLDRAPDAAGFSFWMGESLEGLDLAQVAAFFTGSEEFQARAASEEPGEIIATFYEQLLQRPPELEGLLYWLDYLEEGGFFAGMAVAFATSTEFSINIDDILNRNDWLMVA